MSSRIEDEGLTRMTVASAPSVVTVAPSAWCQLCTFTLAYRQIETQGSKGSHGTHLCLLSQERQTRIVEMSLCEQDFVASQHR